MKELTITCPGCESDLEIPISLFGETVRCPSCNKKLQLPELEKEEREKDYLKRVRTFHNLKRQEVLEQREIKPHQQAQEIKEKLSKVDKMVPERKKLSVKRFEAEKPGEKKLVLKRPSL